jgi:hypothetical protein
MMSKLVSMFMCMYLSTVIRNMLLVLLSSLSSTSSLSMLSSSTMSIGMVVSISVVIGIVYLEAGPSGRSTPKSPNGTVIYRT